MNQQACILGNVYYRLIFVQMVHTTLCVTNITTVHTWLNTGTLAMSAFLQIQSSYYIQDRKLEYYKVVNVRQFIHLARESYMQQTEYTSDFQNIHCNRDYIILSAGRRSSKDEFEACGWYFCCALCSCSGFRCSSRKARYCMTVLRALCINSTTVLCIIYQH